MTGFYAYTTEAESFDDAASGVRDHPFISALVDIRSEYDNVDFDFGTITVREIDTNRESRYEPDV